MSSFDYGKNGIEHQEHYVDAIFFDQNTDRKVGNIRQLCLLITQKVADKYVMKSIAASVLARMDSTTLQPTQNQLAAIRSFLKGNNARAILTDYQIWVNNGSRYTHIMTKESLQRQFEAATNKPAIINGQYSKEYTEWLEQQLIDRH